MKSQLIHIHNLSSKDIESMYFLLGNHFEGVKQDVFEADLNNKNWVILLHDENTHQLKGFSTLLMYDLEFEGEKLSIVYSGDTIVDPSAWSSSALSRSWISSVKQLRREYAQGKLYWLLISSGYRTYRFLPIFWREFYPRYDAATPSHISGLMEFVCRDRFADYYDSHVGVVRFPHPHQLGNCLKGIPKERLQDSHIQFFALRNPNHEQGDELVCLTEICEENLTSAGKRMWFAVSSQKKGRVENGEDTQNKQKSPPMLAVG
jgi:hypothetical protein